MTRAVDHLFDQARTLRHRLFARQEHSRMEQEEKRELRRVRVRGAAGYLDSELKPWLQSEIGRIIRSKGSAEEAAVYQRVVDRILRDQESK